MGKLIKIANGHLSYEVDTHTIAGRDKTFAELFKYLIDTGFEKSGRLAASNGEGAHIDLCREGVRITLGCDIWSGIFVMAYCEEGDEAVSRLAESFRVAWAI